MSSQPQPPSRERIYEGPERTIGIWRQSKWYGGFWLRTILTLGLWYFLVHKHNYITLTTRRVMQKRGNFITSNETALSIENITDVTINKGPLGSILGYGDVSIQTSGSSASEVSMVAVAGPDKLRNAIFDLLDGRFDETKL